MLFFCLNALLPLFVLHKTFDRCDGLLRHFCSLLAENHLFIVLAHILEFFLMFWRANYFLYIWYSYSCMLIKHHRFKEEKLSINVKLLISKWTYTFNGSTVMDGIPYIKAVFNYNWLNTMTIHNLTSILNQVHFIKKE